MDSSNDYDDTSDYNELFLAVHNGELELVHSLLEKYSATETIRGRTLLHVAAARGHAEIAKTLLGNGATIGVQDIKGNTPLDVSLAKGNVQMAEILFQHGAVLSDNDLTNMEPLRNAVSKGNFEMVKLLMANKCNIVDVPNDGDYFPKSSLKLAVSSGRLDILEYLIMNGVKNSKTVEEDKLDLFIIVIFEGSLDTLNFLVDIGIKVQNLDDVFNTTFNLCRHDMWKYLVTSLSKISAKTYFKERQLHFSIRTGQVETVKAIVNEPSNEYESDTFARKLAVYIAVESGSEEILEILLNANYPVTDSLFNFISPLHLAATFEHPRLVKLLLDAGADVNLQTEDYHRTPLHFAATAAQPAVVKFLLKNGADPSITSKRGESPLETALKVYSGIIHVLIPVTPSVFDGLVKVTEMLIQYLNSETTEDLFHYAVKMRVLSSINNSKPKSERLISAVSDFVFRPEIVICIFNYLSEEEVKHFSETFLFEESDLSHYPPELFKLFVEYNIDLKSCFDIELYTSIKNIKHQLLLIGYSKNVPNLLDTISKIINDYDYDGDYYNDVEKKNIIEILKLLFCRLVLLITKCDRIELEECDLIDVIDWVEKCLKEKRVMQRTKVNKNLNFTFYDVLTKSMDKVVGYSNNEDFLTAIKSSQMKFPIYADFLKASVEIAERRRNCIDKSTTLMYRMVKKCYKIQISTSDIRHMFKYLSIVDLQRFSAACS
ncbi:ankyrin repeat and KH domain-containing protein mask-like [Leptopilina heterotoma]|uniref:ankyrin repeat and KH domain-containing protein mask-like n=1 Tax=Leptopilina heterotoma TaxID=63436 RepID=UPI001CA8A56D|nr:ankyrin repeat and KH domain-containing protein mask-like [Leptopilina heterotoma]